MKTVTLFCLPLFLLVAACGGGAEGPAEPSPPAAPPTTPPAPPTPPTPPTTPPTPDPPGAPPPAGLVLIAGGIDSLTFGVGGDSWLRFFAAEVRGALGDGGPGWQSFSSITNGASGAVMTMVGNLREFGISSPEGRYSIDGFGIAQPAGEGSRFAFTPPSRWRQARIFFLKQPGGGTMRCGNEAQGDEARTAIDTAASEPDLGWIDVPALERASAGTTGRGFGCSAINGRVAIFGALATLGPGVAIANWSEGGRWLRDVVGQDAALRRRWFAVLRPAQYYLNGGTNGFGLYTLAEHRDELTAIVADIRAASPDTLVTIVQPNAARDVAPDAYRPFVTIKQEVAAATGARFADDRDAVGDYATASAAGLMADDVHQTAAGYRAVARYRAARSGLPTGTADPGPTGW